MDAVFESALNALGDGGAAAAGGLLVGALFGVGAQRSRFCLRAAVVEFSRGAIGPRTAVWLLCFGAAVFWTQCLLLVDPQALDEARWRAGVGSLSGAALGGLIFGVGMVLARGCPGRLLVLAACGNLRALLAGLVFAVAAQMSLHGAFSGLRQEAAGLWTTAGPNPDLLTMAGAGPLVGPALGAAAAIAAIVFSMRNRVSPASLIFGSGVGVAAAVGWWFTSTLATQTFEPTPVESLTFAGPSADVLMALLAPSEAETLWSFKIGLVPGVALGAATAAALAREWRWEGYDGAAPMRRSLAGAALMGFGAMLAGGCAIGAGVTGGSLFALTAWVALAAFWLGGGLADLVIDRPHAAPAPHAA